MLNMLKTVMIGAAVATASASPALAQEFTGPRVETGAVYTNSNVSDNDWQYGLNAGYDVAVNDRVRVGGEVTTNDLFNNDREIGASARVGYVLTPNMMFYGKAGWANRSLVNTHLNGFQYGGGIEANMTNGLYIKTEYRRTNYENNVTGDTGFIGLGYRF
jgi:outer membrane immunogenic protein